MSGDSLRLEPSWKARVGDWFAREDMRALSSFLRERIHAGARIHPEPKDIFAAFDATPFDDVKDELSYCRVLNNVLRPDIRMLAWCPNPGLDVSARVNCKERRYKYFFTNPAFAPTPGAAGVYGGARGSTREGWLDVAAMREAASYLEGYHDFRNFCKVDPAKQISVILHGLQGQAINGQVYPGAMPPFAGSLNDADIADIANHERTSWGNQGKTITADQVKAARAADTK